MEPPSFNLPLCMDGRMLGDGTGVSSYARALAAAQRRIAPAPLVLADRAAPDAPPRRSRLLRAAAALSPHARRARPHAGGLLVAPDIFRLGQVHFGIHRRLLTVTAPGPPGIMHWSYPVPLRLAGWTNLYTVHDAIPLTDPALTPIDAARHRRLLDRIVEGAAALVTVSNAARDAIVGALGCPPSVVVDCGQPVDVTGGAAPLPPGLTPGRYLLVCGSVEPRKNIARILAAFAASGVAWPLVVAGPDGWRAETLAQALAAPGVVRLPYRTRDELVALIASAGALLMPSLAEGFGLPVAEAMALGTPVLTADAGALAETAGGAALAVDPTDEAALAAAIARLAGDAALRARLAAAGRARAAAFALPPFAERLAALYRACVAAPHRSR